MGRASKRYILGVIAVAALAAVLLMRACDASRPDQTPAPQTPPMAGVPAGDTTLRTESPAGVQTPVAEPEDLPSESRPAGKAEQAAKAEKREKREKTVKSTKAQHADTLPEEETGANAKSEAEEVPVRTAAWYGLDAGPSVGEQSALTSPADLSVPDGDSLMLDPSSGELVVIPKSRKHLRVLGVGIPLPGKPKKRIERGIINFLFVPEGTWSGGVQLSYTEHNNDDYELMKVLDWSGSGYAMQINPYFAWFYNDNNAIGGAFTYRRGLLKIDDIGLNLGDDLDFGIKDIYYLDQSYSGTFLHRSYVGLGAAKRFGLFNESRLTFGGGQGKLLSGESGAISGTYETYFEMQIGIKPGIAVFIQNNVALEAAIGVLGFKYKRVKQVTNQVETGVRSTSSANFKFDLFSISFGMSIYL